ncbi:hypothetical protein ILUMI_03780 [Ignelater luminosus]|uniref:Uncharacterized protein n=1 Tax=Ignelater luminosus TaxID=2038154 RepID=A0A8K0DFY2_IGNLU|nr:hypothetical protein ILUMI_03780 [Ignelater luminosus]
MMKLATERTQGDELPDSDKGVKKVISKHLENKVGNTDTEKSKMNIILKVKDFPDNAGAETVQKFLEEKIRVKIKLNEIQHIGAEKEGKKGKGDSGEHER